MSRDLENGSDIMIYKSKDLMYLALSPDGHWMSIISLSRSTGDYTMSVIPSSGGEKKELFSFKKEEKILLGRSDALTWSIDGSYILFVLYNSNVENPCWELCRVPATGGEIEKLGITFPEKVSSLSVHPDGRHISFSSISRPLSPAVWVMENFLPSD